MSPDQVFDVANTITPLAWVLLAVSPGRRWVTDVLAGRVVPGLLAVLYAAIIATTFAGAEGSVATLAGVERLFSNRWLLVAGWVHYLAFDLLVGTWEARDARARGVPRLLLAPCLFLTLTFGPVGWLAYMAVRARWRR